MPAEAPGPTRAVDAWSAFGRLDTVLFVLGAATLWAASAPASRWAPRARVASGAAAVALVGARAISPPHGFDAPLAGPFVALFAAALMLAAGLADLGAPRSRPAAPQGPPHAAGGAAIYQAGEERAARVESLRALAALSVVAVHVYLISEASLPEPIARVFKGGAYGVFFFLTLSGYLLFRPFARHLIDGVPGLRLRDYALNRALRILPLYFFAVVVLLGLEVNGGLPRDWWRFALFIENFSESTVLRADSPMWSLVVEIHFYIVLPLVAFLVARVARGSRGRAALAIATLGLLSLGLRLVYVSLSSAPNFRWTFSLATLFYFFAGGMLLALLRMAWEERPPQWLSGNLAKADVWMLASVPLWVVSLLRKEFELAVAAAAFLVLAACVLPLRAGLLTRALEWRPLAVLGIASYSLYIWHVPLITTVADNQVRFPPPGGRLSGHPHDLLYVAVAALPVCVAVALASYATIESPFLRLRRQWAARTGARGAAVPDQAPSGQPLEGAPSPKRA